MTIPDVSEKYAGKINTVTIGATADEGGTRTATVTVGGAGAMPFLSFEGELGNSPAVAVEVWDAGAETWPDQLRNVYGEVLSDPAAWAKKAVEFGADLICLRLMGAHPDAGNHSADQCAETVKALLGAVGMPLIIWGCGVDEKDNEILPAVSAAAKGENCLIGTAREKNYRTLVAVCLADKHKLIAESPLDINIAKQVNILCSDAGFPLEDIVVFPTTGALGYGIEYVYSIQERGRLAGLGGDKLLAQPVICDVGFEAWRAKEAKDPPFDCVTDENFPRWGEMWEAATGAVLLQAGAEVLVMRHPKAIEYVKSTIGRFMPAATEDKS
ncbi:MAG: acetyl-CoA decarbonylase/synthase complex subunit delta [Planctomycetota bacterium]|nr:acetyl-CoA decarbonylase/synthase complex subunit delta [Planctomycetota bacterium]